MNPNKKYLRNKIVLNFITDVNNFISRFINLNLNLTCLTDDSIKTRIN